ncbi:hypothetical protein [Flavobacterium sp.]|uniref:hypothetical protein n=1 Tax=Flavobacterium sp. TaxID=239 RepID=UPI00375372B4
MKELDRWLVSTVLNVLKLRKKRLTSKVPNFNDTQFPFYCSKDQLIEHCKINGLLEIPSFLRIYNAMQIGLKNEGIERVMNPLSGYYE